MRYGVLVHRSEELPPLEGAGLLARTYEAVGPQGNVERVENGWRIRLGAEVRTCLYAATPGESPYTVRDALPAGLEAAFSLPGWALDGGVAQGDPWIEAPPSDGPLLWCHRAVARHAGVFHAPSAQLRGEGLHADSGAVTVTVFRP